MYTNNSSNISQKVTVLAGATSGIGLALVNKLTADPQTICIFGRNLPDTYAEEYLSVYDIRLFECDFTDFASMQMACNQFLNSGLQIDTLLLSSGMMAHSYSTTVDNIETQFQVNFLSQHFLIQCLEPQLKPIAKIVFLASDEHKHASLDFEDLFMKKRYKPRAMYQRTKLCQVLLAAWLDARYDGESYQHKILAIHPGTVKSQIGGKHLSGLGKWFYELYRSLHEGMKPEEAARIILNVVNKADSHEVFYYEGIKQCEPSDLVKNTELIAKLIATSQDLIALSTADLGLVPSSQG